MVNGTRVILPPHGRIRQQRRFNAGGRPEPFVRRFQRAKAKSRVSQKGFYFIADCHAAALRPETEASLPLRQQGIQQELVNNLIFSICSPGGSFPIGPTKGLESPTEAGTESWSQGGLIRDVQRREGATRRNSALYSLPAMWAIRSHTRLLYPNSLSYLSGRENKEKWLNRSETDQSHAGVNQYHVTSLTKWSLRAMPAPASKMEEWLSPLKSVDTTWGGERLIHKRAGVARLRGRAKSPNPPGAPCSPGCPSWAHPLQPSPPS